MPKLIQVGGNGGVEFRGFRLVLAQRCCERSMTAG